MSQLGLFVAESVPRTPAPAPVIVRPDAYHPHLSELAFLYTCTEKGNNSGIRFMMSIEDAQAWCESPVSSGQLHGTRWAYHYTSVRNYIACHWGPKQQRVDITGLVDNGQWDARIAELGLRKIGLHEFGDVLGPLGVEVVERVQRRRAA